ncbi:UNVERIFIED_CONTAM: hypothetical protein GTU68_012494, partial [Idotea baltica]|nr:hypothetical protein [Idotea baltica]
ILVIDNYDSFTWNLVDLLRRGPYPVEVYRNDALTVEEVFHLDPKGIVISPGPGRPVDSGVSLEIMHKLSRTTAVLGVCLGHQLMGEVFGLELTHAETPMHGKTSLAHHDQTGLFAGLPSPVQVMRYHSLLLNNRHLPKDISVTAKTQKGEIMGIKHNFLNLTGVQFHPESILTEWGAQMILNWLHSLETPESN